MIKLAVMMDSTEHGNCMSAERNQLQKQISNVQRMEQKLEDCAFICLPNGESDNIHDMKDVEGC